MKKRVLVFVLNWVILYLLSRVLQLATSCLATCIAGTRTGVCRSKLERWCIEGEQLKQASRWLTGELWLKSTSVPLIGQFV
ncbi:hypothetical protein GQ55_2G184500 [Panicum hallii var. hallii]|uniref:Uncharacterized protein n=1 Tax=Panicum hallii var. hallii TaxID=1504633 RepID=A0A2T7EQB4_9POAL|nr:hypothetical protein GQ55_2G184500 [Panicum hallii var. hallii]